MTRQRQDNDNDMKFTTGVFEGSYYSNAAILDLSAYMGNKAVDADSDVMLNQPEELGKRHAPLAFRVLSDTIIGVLCKRKLKSVQVAHSINKGNIYFGMTEVTGKARSFVPVIAWRASHNQRISATIYMGVGLRENNIIVLTNEVPVALRQTINFKERLPVAVEDSIEQLSVMAREHTHTISLMRKTYLSDANAERAICGMIREDILSPSQSGQALAQWDMPDNENLQAKRTVWRLFHAVALGYKPKGDTDAVSTLINRTPRLMAYCKGLVLDNI